LKPLDVVELMQLKDKVGDGRLGGARTVRVV